MRAAWHHLSQQGWNQTITVSEALDRADIARYAGTSGDVNLIHVDEPFAIAAGYRAPLVHGMLTMGLIGTVITDLVGHHQLRSFGGRFVSPVYAGDGLICSVTVRSARRHDACVSIDLDILATNQSGTEVFRGNATASGEPEETP